MWFLLSGLALAAPPDCGLSPEAGRLAAIEAELGSSLTKTDITEASAPLLDRIACLMHATPELTLSVEAHTDSMGAGSFNRSLSQARADAVRDALIARKVLPSHVLAFGLGEDYPIAENSTAEGKAANRRVELHLTPLTERNPAAAALPPATAPAATGRTAPPPRPTPPFACDTWLKLTPLSPADWPGLRCTGDQEVWHCTSSYPFDETIAAASKCLQGSQDGAEWIGTLRSGTLRITEASSGAVISVSAVGMP